jgi:RNA polymerase sigma-70 factor (ECF subfamily)
VENQTDEEIMCRLQNGDIDKSTILFERYHIKMYNYFLRNTFNKDLSMDLSQNLFLRMLKYRKSYDSKMPFKTWLFSMARNLFLDSTKYKFRNMEPLEKVNVASLTENEYDQSEDEKLYRALAALSESDRELIELSRFQHFKYHEIASMMNLSEVNVKVRIHRAISRLREIYFKENMNEIIFQKN